MGLFDYMSRNPVRLAKSRAIQIVLTNRRRPSLSANLQSLAHKIFQYPVRIKHSEEKKKLRQRKTQILTIKSNIRRRNNSKGVGGGVIPEA